MSTEGPWRFVPLADHPEAIPTLAAWFHDEWSRFDGRSPEQIAGQLGQNLQRDQLPITFLAMRRNEIIGTVSLDHSDLPSHDHLTPWLASLYVVPIARGFGVGTALIAHLLAFATTQKLRCIYLWTPGSSELYERLGWRVIETATAARRAIKIMARNSSA